jgi:hypothetical protein
MGTDPDLLYSKSANIGSLEESQYAKGMNEWCMTSQPKRLSLNPLIGHYLRVSGCVFQICFAG